MTGLPRQSDGEPLDDLITAVREAQADEEAAWAKARPLAQHYGRARAELAGEIVRRMFEGESLRDLLEIAGAALRYSSRNISTGETVWDRHAVADAIGRDLALWIVFNSDLPAP